MSCNLLRSVSLAFLAAAFLSTFSPINASWQSELRRQLCRIRLSWVDHRQTKCKQQYYSQRQSAIRPRYPLPR